MTFEFDAPTQDEIENTGGGNYLREPGTYHLCITEIKDEAIGQSSGLKVTAEVMAGTVPDQKGKTVTLTFWHPKLNSKDQGAFSRKRQARLLVAANVLKQEQLGQRVSIDLNKAVGQQVIATLDYDSKDEEKKYLELNYADIFHIDDPDAAKFPRDDAAIAMIPKANRLDASAFAKPDKPQQAKPQQPTGPTEDALAGL